MYIIHKYYNRVLSVIYTKNTKMTLIVDTLIQRILSSVADNGELEVHDIIRHDLRSSHRQDVIN